VGLEVAGELSEEDSKDMNLCMRFEKCKNIWMDKSKLSKKMNGSARPLSIQNPCNLDFDLSQFKQSELMIEYLYNSKKIEVIPISLQFRHKV